MGRTVPRKLLYSLLIVLAWLSLVAEGSHSLFVDTATLTGSTVTTGTAGLLISNSQNASSTIFAESRPGFSFSLVPGQSDDKFFLLKNSSASPLALDIIASASLPEGAPDLSKSILIELTPVTDDGIQAGSPVKMVLNDLTTNPIALNASISQGDTQRFRIRAFLMPAYAGQGDNLSFDMVFTGTQHVS